MNMRILILTLLLAAVNIVYAQQPKKLTEIRGQVFSSVDKTPLRGASVSSENSSKAAVTDSLGKFVLKVSNRPDGIIVKHNDFNTEEVMLWGRQTVDVYLIPLTSFGYVKSLTLPFKNRKLADKTGNSTTILAKDIDRGRHFADEMLIGNVAGVRTLQKSGMPGEGNFISLRGTRSLTGSNTPLIVIDGMPVISEIVPSSVFTGYSRNILNNVSLKEVDNVAVVKGFEAAGFGSIASNGVIMVNTGRAVDMETKVEFETVNGISVLGKSLPLLNAGDFKEYLYRVGQTAFESSTSLFNAFSFLQAAPEKGEPYYAYQHKTDWQKEIFSSAFTTDNILKIKGGDEIAKYSILAGYMQSDGIEDNTRLCRYYARFNGDMKLSRRLAIFTNVGFSYFDNKVGEQGMTNEINPILAAVRKPAILGPSRVNNKGKKLAVWDKVREFGVSNPAAIVNMIEGENALYNLLVNLGLNYSFTDNFRLTGLFGINYDFNREQLFIPGRSTDAFVPLEGGKALNTIRLGVGRTMSYYGNLNLNYGHSFTGGHELAANAGAQLIWRDHLYEYAKGINTATDYDRMLSSVKNADGKSLGSTDELWRWFNMFATVNYNYKKQLYAGVSVSADATSVSGERSDLFNIYPAVNAAWKMGNSSFLRDIAFVNDLTLRGEFSQKGNAMLPAMISKYHYIATDYKEMGGTLRANIPNDKLKPEVVNTINVGADFRTLGNKLSLSVDLYRDQTKDMVLPENLPAAFGSKFRYVNSGEMQTKGLEVGVNAVALTRRDFEWRVGATIATEKSEITSLGGMNEQITTLTDGAQIISRVGETPYSFYGLQSCGVYATSAMAAEDGLTDYRGKSFGAGDLRYVNTDANKIINEKDKMIIGDPTPDFYGGIFTSFRYKNLTLSAQFSYSYGNDVYNAVRRVGEGMVDFSSQTEAVKNSWNHEGHETSIPKTVYGDPMNNSQFSSRWIEDGSYLKLKNLTLNYEYNSSVWIFTKLQAYVTGENLFVLTKYLGYDPEFAYSYDHKMLGVDYGKVPGARTFKLGIRLGF